MGTSSSYKGPRNRSPLLPPWAPPAPDEDRPNDDGNPEKENNRPEEVPDSASDTNGPENTENWGGAKGYMSKFASGNTGYSINNAAKAYVKAMGGAQKASKAARLGKNSAGRLGNFLGSVAGNGFAETLRRFGLGDLIGQPAEKVFASIVDLIAPAGETNEDANARAAVLDALETLYMEFELENGDLSRLNSLGEEDVRRTILNCCKAYIYEKWLQQLGIAIEKKAISPNDALAKEQEAKNFIKESVLFDFEGKSIVNLDFTQGDGKRIIDRIFQEAYLILGQ